MTSGSWDVLEAINTQWDAHGLDDQFIAQWDDASLSARFTALWEAGDVKEGAPRPYCVFEHGIDQTAQLMSADDNTTVQTNVEIDLRFRVHAKNKTQAVDLAKLIVDAFDNARFGATSSFIIGTRRISEYGAADVPDGYLWVIRYKLIQDAEQAINM